MAGECESYRVQGSTLILTILVGLWIATPHRSFAEEPPSESILKIEDVKAPVAEALQSRTRASEWGPDGAKESSSSVSLFRREYYSSDTKFFRQGAQTGETSVHLSLQSGEAVEGGGYDISALYNAGEEEVYFRPSEIFMNFGEADSSFFISLGRKKQNWSLADAVWKRGLYEPRHMDDKLDPEVAGLTGLFAQGRLQRCRYGGFASPLYVPELGPHADLQEGRFQSKNPWFRPPAETVTFIEDETPVFYSLNTPDTEEIVVQGSVGLHSTCESPSGYFIQSSYAYKPVNQLIMGAAFLMFLDDQGDATRVDVEATPRVTYHHIATLEAGQRSPTGWVYWTGLTYEKPIRDETPEKWITQEMEEETYIGTLYLGRQLGSSSRPTGKWWLSYSQVFGGDAADAGEFASDNSLFEARYQYQQSVQLGASGWLFNIKKSPLMGSTRLIYDHKQHGVVWSSSLNYLINSSWRLGARAEVIGLVDRQGEVTDGFTSLYRSNDNVSAGVSYVF